MSAWGGRKVAKLRLAVLVRHGSTCVLCHQPINLAARWPDGRSFTIEHVAARSTGGTDMLDNLRPAHLSCNSARGNRPHPPDRRPTKRGRLAPPPAGAGGPVSSG
jgi:5-methylcytosine-specific restriction endonuclease McrA